MKLEPGELQAKSCVLVRVAERLVRVVCVQECDTCLDMISQPADISQSFTGSAGSDPFRQWYQLWI